MAQYHSTKLTLECDQCEKDDYWEIDADTQGHLITASREELDDMAEADGWLTGPNVTLCPTCADRYERKTNGQA